jgi:hypothetical protein
MNTHTTRAWANATVSLYAASPNAPGNTTGFYQIDNVTLQYAPAGSATATTCDDPVAPAAPSGSAVADVIVNGSFTGTLAPWTTFGQIQGQLAGGVFEFVKLAGSPAGVVLQPTGHAIAANQILTSTLQLGNSSGVRKRVTVILHDNDFSDLAACTFWLPPGQPLTTYRVRTYATDAWTNATLSVYPATVGAEQWIQLDNATLAGTPAASIVGTECDESVAGDQILPPRSRRTVALPGMRVADGPGHDAAAASAEGGSETMLIGSPLETSIVSQPSGSASVALDRALDLTSVATATLRFDAWLASDGLATVQISTDGGASWEIARVLGASDTWIATEVDLGGYIGETIHVRFNLDAGPGESGEHSLHVRNVELRAP